MTRVVFQPTGPDANYANSVGNPVALDRLVPHLDEQTANELLAEYGEEPIPVWGVTPGKGGVNEPKWAKISPGDLVLFLRKGAAIASARVTMKAHSPALAKELWSTQTDGQTWEYLYFLRDVRPLEIPYSRLNEAAGYNSANQFYGVNVMDEERSARFLSSLDVGAGELIKDGHSKVWWVNQGTSYRQQRDTNSVWAPQFVRDGSTRSHWRNVMLLRTDERVLHYAEGVIRAVGRVEGEPRAAPRPQGLDSLSSQWADEGFLAAVRYQELSTPIPLNDIPLEWRIDENARNAEAPFDRTGGIKQGYMFRLSAEFVEEFRRRFVGILGPADEARDGGPDVSPEGETQLTGDFGGLVDGFADNLRKAGLRFDDELVARFVAAVITKPFVILTGVSGSGKTKLAQALAAWLGNSTERGDLALVAVGADWTASDRVLGYPDALDPKNYVKTPILELLLRALQVPEEPHVLILDEMNLSHVERYFADVLSAMESGDTLLLHVGNAERGGVPPRVDWPRNLLVIGTVNVDETTYMFSPKVLDRANVIEFHPGPDELRQFLKNPSVPNLSAMGAAGTHFRSQIAARPRQSVRRALQAPIEHELALFFDVLAQHGWEFGFRTAMEIVVFAGSLDALRVGEASVASILDAQVAQKLLPRLNGSQRRLEPTLWALSVLCFDQRIWPVDEVEATRTHAELFDLAVEASRYEPALNPRESARYGGTPYLPIAFAKVQRMLRNIERNGFTSFAEA